MNPQDPRHPWPRLVAAARLVPDTAEMAAPYGFSTRVAALALGAQRVRTVTLDRLALRALGVASLLAIASIAINYSSISSTSRAASPREEQVQAEDPLAVLLDT